MAETTTVNSGPEASKLPRVAITYCTQCRWMLRAAYFGQELLSTFSTAIGEVALIPATGGLFQVHLTYVPPQADGHTGTQAPEHVLVWDRKSEGGFPETKVLKQRVRNYIEPGRDLGHSDKPSSKPAPAEAIKIDAIKPAEPVKQAAEDCEDCR